MHFPKGTILVRLGPWSSDHPHRLAQVSEMLDDQGRCDLKIGIIIEDAAENDPMLKRKRRTRRSANSPRQASAPTATIAAPKSPKR